MSAALVEVEQLEKKTKVQHLLRSHSTSKNCTDASQGVNLKDDLLVSSRAELRPHWTYGVPFFSKNACVTSACW